MTVRVVQAARLPASSRPLPIYSGSPPEPIACEWLAIAHVQHERGDSYNLYFLDPDGEELECLQFETLRIAVDQAAEISGVRSDEWTTLEVEVEVVVEDGPIDVRALSRAVGGSR